MSNLTLGSVGMEDRKLQNSFNKSCIDCLRVLLPNRYLQQ